MKHLNAMTLKIYLLLGCIWAPFVYSQPALGVYAYVDMRGEKDAKAKVAEFSSASRSGGHYYFRSVAGRQSKVSSTKYRGVFYYPKSLAKAESEQLMKLFKGLR